MPLSATALSRLVATGLTLLGLGGAAAAPATEPAPAAPETIEVAATPGSRIDPALLSNPTLRRAIAMVGPELVREPEIREAIRSGQFGEHLLSNPAVQRAMVRVGPMIMSDPELSAAIQSGELDAGMINDPAVVAILRSLDPTLLGEPVIEMEPVSDPAPVVVTALPEIDEPTEIVEVVEIAEQPENAAIAVVVEAPEIAEVAEEPAVHRAWELSRRSPAHPRHRARPAVNDRAIEAVTRARERRVERGVQTAGRAIGLFMRAAFDVAAGAGAAGS